MKVDIEKSMQKFLDKIHERFGVSAERLLELAKADCEGRIKIYTESKTGTCGTCKHFKRTPGTRSGKCDMKKWCKNRYGRQVGQWEFNPSQSRKACKRYEADNKGGDG